MDVSGVGEPWNACGARERVRSASSIVRCDLMGVRDATEARGLICGLVFWRGSIVDGFPNWANVDEKVLVLLSRISLSYYSEGS